MARTRTRGTRYYGDHIPEHRGPRPRAAEIATVEREIGRVAQVLAARFDAATASDILQRAAASVCQPAHVPIEELTF